ncbi:MAG: RNA polymerase sigma factor [Planctomycetota bacterium]
MGRNDDDLALLARCIAEEPGAWVEFVNRFAPTTRAIARRYLKLHGQPQDDNAVDDVTQDVFVAITRRNFRLLKNYDPRYTFKTYLGVITRTEVHRQLRKRRPSLGDPQEIARAAGTVEDTASGAATAEETEVLTAALEKLPGRDAEILRLRFLREMDYKAIANVMRIPEASVGQTLFRAKQKLIEALKGLGVSS